MRGSDGGGSWTPLAEWSDTDVSGDIELPLDAWAGQSFQIRFSYVNLDPFAWDLYWQIDDVRVGAETGSLVLGDFNEDGVLNGLDIPGFKSALADPAAYYNETQIDPNVVGDFNGDTVFNGLDIPGFKTGLAGAAVPEPLTLSLVAAGFGLLLRRRLSR